MVGGSLLMTSHNCVDVRRVGILNYGVADKIDMRWRNEQITIIPSYRPCTNNAAGSLWGTSQVTLRRGTGTQLGDA